MRKFICFVILLLLAFNAVFAQEFFSRNLGLVVLDEQGDTLANPWGRGFNSVQFSEIDLDLDGVRDLFVFDRTGNKISTFINTNKPNTVSYRYAPEYINAFPKMFSWVLLRDYNCDGKMDIFTHSGGGMAVYKNESTDGLAFSLQTDLLFTQRTSYINLFVTSDDIPAIDDIDNDGDLDILTFSILGSYVEYHKNLSMENHGTCDSLDFELRNQCWGYFSEDASTNKVRLFDTCQFNVLHPEKREGGNKHAGSSLLTLDIDGNNTKELVLGDLSFNNMVLLYNGDNSSDLTQSSIIDQDSLFPKNHLNTVPVDLDIFPAGYYIDVNNDSVKDLIVAPNCYRGCKNRNNVLYYQNSNKTNNPDFDFITSGFLQEDMIDVGEGAHPVFFDHNSDGLMDMVVGNYGNYDPTVDRIYHSFLSLYENIGTPSSPVFHLKTSDYAGISSINLDVVSAQPALALHPTFGDIDGDGDEDMLLGDEKGYIHYFENTPASGNVANFELNQAQYQNIDVGNNAAPQLIDLNRDSLLDLVVGNNSGRISYYENVGTSTMPSFILITDTLGNIDVTSPNDFDGLSVPFFFEKNEEYVLLTGSRSGYLHYYENIEGNLEGTFLNVDSTFLNVNEGEKSSISLSDITDDGRLDLLIGNNSGGISYYEGGLISNVWQEKESVDFTIFPNPSKGWVQLDFGEYVNYGEGYLTITNILGKEFYQKKIDEKRILVDLNSYANGVYLFQFNHSSGNKTYKVVKSN